MALSTQHSVSFYLLHAQSQHLCAHLQKNIMSLCLGFLEQLQLEENNRICSVMQNIQSARKEQRHEIRIFKIIEQSVKCTI